MKKIQTICIDTLTSIQENQYSADKKKPGHDQWRDYGISIHSFMTQLQNEGFDLVLILGDPGTGKSSGMRTLETGTNIWYNADNKNPTWIGGTKEYGKKATPRVPYHIIPKSYDAIILDIQNAKKHGVFVDNPVAFVMGHVETYKAGGDSKMRLKTLGKLANKMQIEGKLENVLYSKVEMSEGSSQPEFVLHTQNDGFNTARSNQGMLEGVIPNDYRLILDNLNKF